MPPVGSNQLPCRAEQQTVAFDFDLKGALLSLLSPAFCAACNAALARDTLFCEACDDAGDPVVVTLGGDVRVIAAGPYEGALADAVRRLKYGGRPDLARHLGARVASAVHAAGIAPPFTLVPVPLHPKKLARRGYNQSALLATEVARRLRCHSSFRALARTRETEDQASLERDARLSNAESAFAARSPVPGRVLLVDDVVTTGATAHACVDALRRAGMDVAGVAAVAKTR